MRIYLLTLISTFSFSAQIYAQILFIDQESKAPIAALSIYNEKGQHLGLTDKDGRYIFSQESVQQLSFPTTITTEHISYESKLIPLSNATDELVVELMPTTIQMDPITINNASSDVTILTGYFRNLETFDNKTKYFSDGIAVFYLPNNGGKVRYKLSNYRIFTDDSITQDYDTKMGPFFKIARLPTLNNKSFLDQLKSYDINKEDPNNLTLEKNKREIGRIEISEKNNTSRFYIDHVLPDTVKTQKIFRIEAHTKSEVRLENYASSNIEKLSPNNLINIHEHATGSIKRKAEFGHIPYEGLVQFYVMSRSGMSMKEYKAISSTLESNIYKTEKTSRYSYPFWEDLAPYSIPSINTGLEEKLRTTMRLVE